MAVADLGVAMGPRNRRRLTTGGIALAVTLAAVVASLFLIRSASHAGPSASSTSGHVHSVGGVTAIHLYSGMSKAQVLRSAGRPAARQGSCWLYHTNQEVGPPGQALHLDALKACFFTGHVYDIHYKVDGAWMKPGPARLPAPVG